ncbi:MAG: anti-sigma factor [Rubrivivax sp.]|nr:anti-sigma factor [Rubrivivax sp.]
MEPDRLSHEQLSAWVDGELDAADRERVEAWLRQHPDDAETVRRWTADRDALRAALAGVHDEPVPAGLRQTVWRGGEAPDRAAARERGFGAARAASVAGVAIVAALLGALAGGTVVWQWQQAHAPAGAAVATSPGIPVPAGPATVLNAGWVQRAAQAHSVYVPEPRHAVEVAAQEEHLARWLTRRIEVPVTLFDLSAEGFRLVGGRLLPDGPGKSAQLMYQDGDGRRVTLYLRKPEPGSETAFRWEQQGDLGLFYWVEPGAGFALVGALPRERLLALAQAVYRQHPGALPPAPAGPAPAAPPKPSS